MAPFFKKSRDFFPAAAGFTGTTSDSGNRSNFFKISGSVFYCLYYGMELDALADTTWLQAGQNFVFGDHVSPDVPSVESGRE